MRKWPPLPIFQKFNPPCSEIGDGTKLLEHFGNHLTPFLIFSFGIVSSDTNRKPLVSERKSLTTKLRALGEKNNKSVWWNTSVQEFLLLYFLCIFREMKWTSLWILVLIPILLTLQPDFSKSKLSFFNCYLALDF